VASTNAASFDSGADDVFGRIAGRYDVLCDLFSFGIHRLWKRRVASLIAQEPWSGMLDAAAGTGDVVLRVIKHRSALAGRDIVVSDISPAMLRIAQRRTASSATPLDFQLLDAHAMPGVPDASFDLYSISLGLKICDRAQVLREAFRVLRPGGRFIALEASAIVVPWLHRLYLTYMKLCMPTIGWIATGGDASAYRYLLKGVHDFPDAEHLAAELSAVGFVDVSFERLSLGIVAIHMARKPTG
jgi:ubiquinone/menaquinone biosynthesis methyltransferase